MNARTTTVLGALTICALMGNAGIAGAACTETGFIRDGINLTAALINPAAADIPASLDATGCNIGVYVDSGTLNLVGKEVYGANYFGVAVNADVNNVVVHINNSFIHNIGEKPFNGAQHGDAIYIRSFFVASVVGEITGNTIFGYQKSGIVANGRGVKLTRIDNNRVFGLGHVNFIAQNGIQVGYGAMPFPSVITNNTVVGNSYSGAGDGSASAGILVIGGPGFGDCPDGAPCPYSSTVVIGYSKITGAAAPNSLLNNDVGVFIANVDTGFVSPATPTNVIVFASTIGDDSCYNPYQAGISAQGNTDYFYYNYVFQGGGYSAPCGYGIDVYDSIAPQAQFNNVTPTSSLPVVAKTPAAKAPAKTAAVKPAGRAPASRPSPDKF